MDIPDAIKKSLRKIYIDPRNSHTEIKEGVSTCLSIKGREKEYFKKTIRLNIHQHYCTRGLDEILKQDIIDLTEYNSCWVKDLGNNVFYILV